MPAPKKGNCRSEFDPIQPPVPMGVTELVYTLRLPAVAVDWGRARVSSNRLTSSDPADTVEVAGRGADPMWNKVTAFSPQERRMLGIEGLVPFKSTTQAHQAARIYEQLHAQPDDLQRYLLLSALQNRNTRLFYRLLREHLE